MGRDNKCKVAVITKALLLVMIELQIDRSFFGLVRDNGHSEGNDTMVNRRFLREKESV